jgi:hypothetical protein
MMTADGTPHRFPFCLLIVVLRPTGKRQHPARIAYQARIAPRHDVPGTAIKTGNRKHPLQIGAAR